MKRKIIVWSLIGLFGHGTCLAAPAGEIGLSGGEKMNTAASFVASQQAAGKKANRLLQEKSPYLLQHAFQPVDWHPWGEKAFAMAARENKPIFLSIGYSTCHWCHVMARESFDDPKIAAILNQFFICIKVDREERPDLDQIYMTATQAMTGQGGWPLSLFLTPDLKPFFAGTYFPPEAKYGKPGFGELLHSIATAWQEQHQTILANADIVLERVKELSPSSEKGSMSTEIAAKSAQAFAELYDPQHGGFGNAPKFPRPVALSFLLRYAESSRENKFQKMALHTMKNMAKGGIFDHVGGGFHRYSVDRVWHVPHFEKMLYDQAQLAEIYLEGFQITRDKFYQEVATQTLDYVLRELSDPKGGFYSAEDADSPFPEDPERHGEGAFYVWSAAEMKETVGETAADPLISYFGITEHGNALQDPHDEFQGKNILFQAESLESTAQKFKLTRKEMQTLLSQGLQRLHKKRQSRPRPHLDDKILTSWNGLMISALAKGGRITGNQSYIAAAEGAAVFIKKHMWDSSTATLLHRFRQGSAGIAATLDDYAFLVRGLLDLFEASLDYQWLSWAIQLHEQQIVLFHDKNNGGFFETSGLDPSVVLRLKADYDGAEPAGNSIAAHNLLRLAMILDSDDLSARAGMTLDLFSKTMSDSPLSLPQMLSAHDFQNNGHLQIIIAGPPKSPDTQAMLETIASIFRPNKIILPAEKAPSPIKERLPFLEAMTMIDGKSTAYLCQNFACQAPTNDPAVLAKQLAAPINRQDQQ